MLHPFFVETAFRMKSFKKRNYFLMKSLEEANTNKNLQKTKVWPRMTELPVNLEKIREFLRKLNINSITREDMQEHSYIL